MQLSDTWIQQKKCSRFTKYHQYQRLWDGHFQRTTNDDHQFSIVPTDVCRGVQFQQNFVTFFSFFFQTKNFFEFPIYKQYKYNYIYIINLTVRLTLTFYANTHRHLTEVTPKLELIRCCDKMWCAEMFCTKMRGKRSFDWERERERKCDCVFVCSNRTAWCRYKHSFWRLFSPYCDFACLYAATCVMGFSQWATWVCTATTTATNLTALFIYRLRCRIINTEHDAKAMLNRLHLAVISFVPHTKSEPKKAWQARHLWITFNTLILARQYFEFGLQ